MSLKWLSIRHDFRMLACSISDCVVSTETKFWNRNILLKKLFFLVQFNLCWSWMSIFHHNLRRSQQSSNMIIIRAAWILIILTDFACNFNYPTVPSSLFNHIISGSSRIFHAFVVGCLDFKERTCRFQRNPLNGFFSLSWSSHSFCQISGYPGHWKILFGKLHPWVSPFASSSHEHRFGSHQSEVQIFEGSQESQILE